MHEAKFTEEIVAVIIAELKKYPGRRAQRVALKVGAMFHLEPDSVRMHYQLLTHGTALEGVALDLKEEPVCVLCQRCGQTNPVEDHHLLMCPACDAMSVTVISSNEIVTESVELE